jgi:acylphosphatase
MALRVNHQRVHLVIEGLVQGVSFRAFASDEALKLGLKGWVKNLPDGRVETIAEGPRDRLEAFVAWCQHGPDMARVSGVNTDWASATDEFRSFGVRR